MSGRLPENLERTIESFDNDRHHGIAEKFLVMQREFAPVFHLECPTCNSRLSIESWETNTELSVKNVDWKDGIKDSVEEALNLSIPIGTAIRNLSDIRKKTTNWNCGSLISQNRMLQLKMRSFA